jgi:competence protein ComEC
VPAVLRHVPVGMVVECGSAVQGPLVSEVARLIDSLRIPHRVVRRGELLGIAPSARCYVLSPGEGSAPDDTLDNHAVNNQSVVLRLVYGRTSILLSGDAEEGVEGEVAARFASFLRSEVLKTGHHGSRTSSSSSYLDAVGPAVALISVGARNTFGHPSVAVLERLAARGIRILRTDRAGALILESDGASWREVDWRSSP